MALCTRCKKQFELFSNKSFQINGIYLCKNCTEEEGIYLADYRTCTTCMRTTSKYHGCVNEETFQCSSCIQKEHDDAMEDFLNDPDHKDILVEDLFQAQQKRYIRAFIIAMCIALISILTILITIIKGEHDEQTTSTSDYNRKWYQETQKNLNRKGGM